MLNVGLVGLGHVAKHQVAAIRYAEDFDLVAACDSSPANLGWLESSIETYTDIDVMLKRADLDIVVVATPNKLHVDHGIRVMEAGQWLVVEKPVAETQARFDSLLETRARCAGHCTVALHAAFGTEVTWFISELKAGSFDQHRFDSFHCQFYDPYITDGELDRGALSLGGAWMDSGINSLSVICQFIEPECLTISDSQMTRVSNADCLEARGIVDFDVSDRLLHGSGSIDTNWTLGLDNKVTALGIANGTRKLILDHSEQMVILSDQENEQILFSCENNLPRLTNHYIGVFEDLAKQVQSGKDNFEYCQKLHSILYQAECWRE